MKTVLLQCLRAGLAVLLLLGLVATLVDASHPTALPERLQMGALLLVIGVGVFAALLHRVRGEDRIAGLEAALCREQKARSQADQALAESDVLLDRLTARRGRRTGVDPVSQLAAIQAELLQLRQHCARADPVLASRVDLLCTRVACVARALTLAPAMEAS